MAPAADAAVTASAASSAERTTAQVSPAATVSIRLCHTPSGRASDDGRIDDGDGPAEECRAAMPSTISLAPVTAASATSSGRAATASAAAGSHWESAALVDRALGRWAADPSDPADAADPAAAAAGVDGDSDASDSAAIASDVRAVSRDGEGSGPSNGAKPRGRVDVGPLAEPILPVELGAVARCLRREASPTAAAAATACHRATKPPLARGPAAWPARAAVAAAAGTADTIGRGCGGPDAWPGRRAEVGGLELELDSASNSAPSMRRQAGPAPRPGRLRSFAARWSADCGSDGLSGARSVASASAGTPSASAAPWPAACAQAATMARWGGTQLSRFRSRTVTPGRRWPRRARARSRADCAGGWASGSSRWAAIAACKADRENPNAATDMAAACGSAREVLELRSAGEPAERRPCPVKRECFGCGVRPKMT